jgi:hypothetical protein
MPVSSFPVATIDLALRAGAIALLVVVRLGTGGDNDIAGVSRLVTDVIAATAHGS